MTLISPGTRHTFSDLIGYRMRGNFIYEERDKEGYCHCGFSREHYLHTENRQPLLTGIDT